MEGEKRDWKSLSAEEQKDKLKLINQALTDNELKNIKIEIID